MDFYKKEELKFTVLFSLCIALFTACIIGSVLDYNSVELSAHMDNTSYNY